MDIVLTDGTFTPGEILKINYCRIYLNVHTLSNITLADGYTIDPNILKGLLSLQSSTSKLPPIKQLRPAERVWTLWRKACGLFSTKGQLTTKVG